MKAPDAWARRLKRRLEQAGFRVTMVDPELAMEQKKSARRRDAKLLAEGKATPEELQLNNSFFGTDAKLFRIVSYGGLDEK